MTDSPKTHYLNSDFDLSLRPRPRQVEHPKLIRQVRELSLQALLGAGEGDSVLARADVPDEFLDHLQRHGIPVPTVLRHPRVDPATRFRPFGWSEEAAGLNRLHTRPSRHPDPAIVRRANSRSFALELEHEIDADTPRGRMVESRSELESFLAAAPDSSAWLLKSEHGNAGLANRRLPHPRLDPVDRRFVDERFQEDDRLLIEPWLPRERDWCVIFDTPYDPGRLRVHETVCTADGALIGARFEPGDGRGGPDSDTLGVMAEAVAARLEREGYFGPVCVDALTWRQGDRLRLRPFVDLNCRLSMSDAAHRLWRRIAPDRNLLYRFFNRRKVGLPAELNEVVAALGERCWNPDSRRGILLASPLRLSAAGESWRAGKLAFLFIADDRPEVFALERWFRERFEV